MPAKAAWTAWAADHPEWWSLGLSAAAWAGILASPGHAAWPPLCLANQPSDGTGMLLFCALMPVAMVPPLAVPLIRHVAVRSLVDRRRRAVTVFLLGTLAPWLLVAMAAAAAMRWLPARMAALGFVLAALWQLTPLKRRALRRCHRTFPLTLTGWGAHRDCFVHGTGYGMGCIGSCWAMMLGLMLAGHDPVLAVCVQGLALVERRTRMPHLGSSAAILAGFAGVVALSATRLVG
jgi:predicted metal-binding membrane protein